jgi:hypothetical protein
LKNLKIISIYIVYRRRTYNNSAFHHRRGVLDTTLSNKDCQ